jgi:hypothetical protein
MKYMKSNRYKKSKKSNRYKKSKKSNRYKKSKKSKKKINNYDNGQLFSKSSSKDLDKIEFEKKKKIEFEKKLKNIYESEDNESDKIIKIYELHKSNNRVIPLKNIYELLYIITSKKFDIRNNYIRKLLKYKFNETNIENYIKKIYKDILEQNFSDIVSEFENLKKKSEERLKLSTDTQMDRVYEENILSYENILKYIDTHQTELNKLFSLGLHFDVIKNFLNKKAFTPVRRVDV